MRGGRCTGPASRLPSQRRPPARECTGPSGTGSFSYPAQIYQRALLSGVDGVEKAVKLLEGQAQAITRSAERIQTSAEQAGKGIQETYAAVVEKMKGVYQG